MSSPTYIPTPLKVTSPGFSRRASPIPPGRQSPPCALVRIPSDASPLPLSPASAHIPPINAIAGPSAPPSPRTSFSTSGSSKWSPSGTSSSEEDSPPRNSLRGLRTYASYPTLQPASTSKRSSGARKFMPRIPGGRVWCWLISRLGFARYHGTEFYGDEWERQALMRSDRRGSKPHSRWNVLPTRLDIIIGLLVSVFVFAAGLTIALCHILNPDKEPLPWKTYCAGDIPAVYSLQTPSSAGTTLSWPATSSELTLLPVNSSHPKWPYTTPDLPSLFDADLVDPVGVYVAVFTTVESVERRHMIRQSYMTHWRSRRRSTQGVRVQFVIGQPNGACAAAIENEINAFNDIVILPVKENMNSGKTHAFFRWAAENATVPHFDWSDHSTPVRVGEKRPDYVVKADDDSFLMLGELERHLRVVPRSKTFWGYLVKDSFMAGEAYAFSFDLVQYLAETPALRTHTVGKEDKLVAKWITMHPQAEDIMWITERCWIYDHPKAGTVYSHGFLFPSHVAALRSNVDSFTAEAAKKSTVSRFGSTFGRYFTLYKPPAKHLSVGQKVEALVEGSEMSTLRHILRQDFRKAPKGEARWTGPLLKQKIQEVYDRRPSRQERFLDDSEERGGTVVVHFIKTQEWWVDTMLALLGGPEEREQPSRGSGPMSSINVDIGKPREDRVDSLRAHGGL